VKEHITFPKRLEGVAQAFLSDSFAQLIDNAHAALHGESQGVVGDAFDGYRSRLQIHVKAPALNMLQRM
jgi:hypothetical protein